MSPTRSMSPIDRSERSRRLNPARFTGDNHRTLRRDHRRTPPSTTEYRSRQHDSRRYNTSPSHYRHNDTSSDRGRRTPSPHYNHNNSRQGSVTGNCTYCERHHPRGKQNCPAANVDCWKCGKLEHFDKVCKSACRKQNTVSSR
jgi:hypothetical protein